MNFFHHLGTCSCVHFSCQFVVRDGEDYSVHMMDPDVLVKWEAVEQVVSSFRMFP